MQVLKSATLKHVLVAVGLAVAAGLAVVPETGNVPWRHAIVASAGALLAGLGVGYAYRQTPPNE